MRLKASKVRNRMTLIRARHESGFTLVEILAAVTIIGILSALTIIKIATILSAADDSSAKNEIQIITVSEETYHSIGAGSTTNPKTYGSNAQLAADKVTRYMPVADNFARKAYGNAKGYTAAVKSSTGTVWYTGYSRGTGVCPVTSNRSDECIVRVSETTSLPIPGLDGDDPNGGGDQNAAYIATAYTPAPVPNGVNTRSFYASSVDVRAGIAACTTATCPSNSASIPIGTKFKWSMNLYGSPKYNIPAASAASDPRCSVDDTTSQVYCPYVTPKLAVSYDTSKLACDQDNGASLSLEYDVVQESGSTNPVPYPFVLNCATVVPLDTNGVTYASIRETSDSPYGVFTASGDWKDKNGSVVASTSDNDTVVVTQPDSYGDSDFGSRTYWSTHMPATYVPTKLAPNAPTSALLKQRDLDSNPETSLDFSWDAISNISQYVWEVSSTANFASIVNSGTVTTNSAIAYNLNQRTTYYGRVRAVTDDSPAVTTANSATASAATYGLAAPTGVTLVNQSASLATSPTQLEANADPIQDATATNIEWDWSTQPAVGSPFNFKETATTNPAYTLASDVTSSGGSTGLTPNTKYYVRAYVIQHYNNASGQDRKKRSPGSVILSATTRPVAPANLKVPQTAINTTTSSSTLNASWDAVSGADSYTIEASTSSTFSSIAASANTTAVSYTLTGLTQSTTYYVRVSTVVDTLYSPASATVSRATLSAIRVTPQDSTVPIRLYWDTPSGVTGITGYRWQFTTPAGQACDGTVQSSAKVTGNGASTGGSGYKNSYSKYWIQYTKDGTTYTTFGATGCQYNGI